MNDTMNSPQSRNSQRVGLGCSIALGAVLLGLVVAALVLGPRIPELLNETTAGAVELSDSAAAAQVAARRAQDISQLNSYGWVNQEANVVHIPVARAMALVAEEGLPVGTAQTGATAALDESSSAGTSLNPPADLANINYQDHVLPIFIEHCSECHGDEDPEEGLVLTTYEGVMEGSFFGSVVTPGEPDNSYLVEQVVTGQMPKRGEDLSEAEIETIIAWIEAGAPETAPASTAATSESTDAEPAAQPVDPATVSFQNDVLPIFMEHCSECHGDDDPEEGLVLLTHDDVMAGSFYGSVVTPGEPDNSYLVEQVVTGQMPKRGEDLSQDEIDAIVAWIEAGAPDN